MKQRATRHLPEHVRVEIVTMLRAPVQHRVLVHDVTGERPVEYSDGERLQRREDLFRGFSNIYCFNVIFKRGFVCIKFFRL